MSSTNTATNKMDDGATPSPLRQVRQFEADEALATQLQQRYNDEVSAAVMQHHQNIEDEFAMATAARNEELSERVVKRMQ